MRIERLILTNIIKNEEYGRKVLPFLKKEYFLLNSEGEVFTLIQNFIYKYNNFPSIESLRVELQSQPFLSNLIDEINDILKEIEKAEKNLDTDWLLEKTETFCQEKAIYNAIISSIHILDGKDEIHSKGLIPKLLQDALSVSFDANIGHDFIVNAEDRFDFYHTVEDKIPFDLDYFNYITRGGLPRKTLNILLAGCVHPDTKVTVRYRKPS